MIFIEDDCRILCETQKVLKNRVIPIHVTSLLILMLKIRDNEKNNNQEALTYITRFYLRNDIIDKID